jgi:hypothetical protein
MFSKITSASAFLVALTQAVNLKSQSQTTVSKTAEELWELFNEDKDGESALTD